MAEGLVIHKSLDNLCGLSEYSEKQTPDKITAIKVENLSKSLNTTLALDDINLAIKEGEKVLIVGPNGCGKTTLVRHFNALLYPDSGRVIVYGKDLSKLSDEELENTRRQIGFVFQRNALFSTTDVSGNIASGYLSKTNSSNPLNEHIADGTDLEKEVRRLFKEVGFEEEYPDFKKRHHTELSGGQRKRIAIARTIAMNPKMIIYDEPTSELSPDNEEIICNLINKMHKSGKTSIIVTNVLNTLDRIGHTEPEARVIMLNKGRKIFDDTYTKFYASNNPSIKKYIRRLS